MPTFSRTPFDPAKPQTYDGTNQSTVPLTADQRTQHANGNTAFSAAHDDVAALESGKADQTALDAHIDAANPHSGSAAKASPATAGNVAQLDAGGDLVDSDIPAAQVARLDAPNFFTFSQVVDIPTGDGGAWLQATGKVFSRMSDKGAGANQEMFESSSQGGAFRIWSRNDDGSAAVAVAEMTIHHENLSGFPQGVLMGNPAGGAQGRYSLNVEGGLYVNGVELTPGGGGVTTFVGLSDTPDNYTAANGFLTRVNAGATALEYVDGTALFQTKPGSATDGVLTRYKANGELEESGIASADVSAHLASTANPHDVRAEQIGAITAVIDDATPQLGGNLETKGNSIVLTRSDDTVVGVVQAGTSVDGGVFAYTDGATPWNQDSGAVTVEPAAVNLYGAAVTIPTLKHAVDTGRQVYVSESGILYGVDPPEPGWTETSTDTGDYSLGTGDSEGPPTQITGLSIDPAADLNAGDTVIMSAVVYVVLGKDGDPTDIFDKSSSIEFGIGINGVFEGAWFDRRTLGPYFEGWIATSLTTTVSTGISGTDTIDLFCRRGTGDDSSCNPWVYGTGAGVPHEMTISTPGAGGGGGGGDVTQGTGGATGEVAVWQDFAGKLVHGTGIAATTVLRNDASATVGSAVGYAATTATQASGGTYTPSPLNGQYVELTGSTATIIDPMTVDGAVSIGVPDGLALTLTGWTVVGTPPSGRVGILECRKVGSILIAAWV